MLIIKTPIVNKQFLLPFYILLLHLFVEIIYVYIYMLINFIHIIIIFTGNLHNLSSLLS